MQPAILIASPVPGLIFVNGRPAGEVGEDRPIAMPVAGYGAVYLQHHPFDGAFLPMTRRMTLSAGTPVADSVRGQPGLFAVVWPNGLTEIELIPDRRAEASLPLARIRRGEIAMALYGAPINRLEIESGGATFYHLLPEGAGLPDADVRPDGIFLSGALEQGGRYAMALSPDGSELRLSESGKELTWEENGALRVLRELNDTVGHARLDIWVPSDSGYAIRSTELMWAAGAPRWPGSPVDTALAAAEAAQLGLMDEAAGYLAPEVSDKYRPALADIAAWDGVTQLKHALPDGRPAIGAMRASAPNLMTVLPIWYTAVPGGGAQGYWRIDWLKTSV